jgi:hypothetical protein
VQRVAGGRKILVRRQRSQLSQQRPEGEVGGSARVRLRGALDRWRQAEVALQLVGEPGLADAGLTDQADSVTTAAGGAFPGLAEHGELRLAAAEGGDPTPERGLQARDDRAFTVEHEASTGSAAPRTRSAPSGRTRK